MSDTDEPTNPGTPSTLSEVRALRKTVQDLANAISAIHADLRALVRKFDEHSAFELLAQAAVEQRLQELERKVA